MNITAMLKAKTPKVPTLTPPILMKDSKGPLVVLFYDLSKGVVVHGDQRFLVGHHSNSWLNLHDSEWEVYNGDVVISQTKE